MSAEANDYPWFGRHDLSAFWALFADNLANMVIVSAVCGFVFHMSPDIVFGHILPGLGVALLLGLGFYAMLARWVARDERRFDVTALPYGISTPVLFVYLFGIIGPVYGAGLGAGLDKSAAGEMAWQVGLAAAFLGGLLEMGGSALGPFLKRITPRAGMLGTLAGIALVYIATVPLAEIMEHPLVGMPGLAIVVIALIAGIKLPGGLPAGLVAILLGVFMALTTGLVDVSESPSLSRGFAFPLPVFGDLFEGLRLLFVDHTSLLMVVLPVEIYNFIETMNNVESAEAAGDEYPVRLCQVADGAGTLIGALFGSPFPTTVYIGHPAYKKLGARCGYALAVGVVMFLIAVCGFMDFLRHWIPVAAVAPILVFVGVTLCGEAFRATPKAHGAAVAVSLIPHVADIVVLRMTGVLREASTWLGPVPGELGTKIASLGGPLPADLVSQFLVGANIHYMGLVALSKGAILVGLIWGAIVALLIEKKVKNAGLFAVAAYMLTVLGVIHQAGGLGFYPENSLALSYLLLAGLCFLAQWFPSITNPHGVKIKEKVSAGQDLDLKLTEKKGPSLSISVKEKPDFPK